MDIILGVLDTLKINHTIWIQMACFMVSYFALSTFLFKPYYRAYKQRQQSTVGGEKHAERLTQEARELTGQYESKAREVNSKLKAVYDATRSTALKERDQLVRDAEAKAQAIANESKQKLANQVAAVRGELKNEVTTVSQTIASKLVGKEITQ